MPPRSAGRPRIEPKRPERVYKTWPVFLQKRSVTNPNQWLTEPDSKPAKPLGTAHRANVSPLTKIARFWHSPSWRQGTKRLDLYSA
jgi:hypothetical protein